jgi:hypothetical protein
MSSSDEIPEGLKINSLISSTDFVQKIENFSVDHNIDYIDAVVEYCRRNNIEIETAASIIKSSPMIKGKIQKEAIILNILQK